MKKFQLALLSSLLVGGADAATPVDEIIEMLKGMTTNLEAEAKSDKELDERMQAWCSKESTEKRNAITVLKANTIPDLEAEVTRTRVEQSKLGTEIGVTTTNKGKATTSLEAATNQRANGKSAFDKSSTFMTETIDSLSKAEVILAKSSGNIADYNKKTAKYAEVSSFMSKSRKLNSEESVSKVLEIVRDIQSKYPEKFADVLSEEQRNAILLQGTAAGPSTDSILGIVREMHETFERDLKDAESNEARDIKTFEELKTAKEDEIQACADTILSKETQKAAASESEATASRDLKTARDDLATNEKYAEEIRVRCKQHDEEYKERSTLRSEEIATVAKATGILTDPKSLKNFDKTFTAPAMMFLQTGESDAHQVAIHALDAIAKDSGSPKVAALVMQAKTSKESLERVKKAIAKMIEELALKKKNENEQNTLCLSDIAKNKEDTEKFTKEKAESEDLAKSLQANIDELSNLVLTTEKEVAQLEQDLADATATRNAENKAFEAAVEEQTKTQNLLQKAIMTMRRTYKTAALVQAKTVKKEKQPKAPEGDEAFESYKKTDSTGVMGLFEKILADTKALEEESRTSEASALNAFNAFKQETFDTVTSKKRFIINKNSDKGKLQKNLLLTEDDVRSDTETLVNLAEGLKAIKKECDFLVENFEKRQNGYTKEIEALDQAKGILANFADFKRRLVGF
eukprot:TRINITY_DN109685_c0_g1_i1.p1 TRINITY_DN109685_c0_g1~~TRINITY_DN109685_c0_g1_i1.p1  ORF type:complete len:691 (-),score=229.13 TRINITY_DN109685_c0_g1_i1:96-2168(-)